MNNFWIIIPVAAIFVFVIAMGIVQRNRTRNDAEKGIRENNEMLSPSGVTDVAPVQEWEIDIPIELLPATTQFDGKNLFEITDTTVVARISELVPFTTQTGTRILENSALDALKSTELIKMDIPFSRLSKSKDVIGAARGYVHGGKGVAAQANLTKVDMTQITKASTVANGVANVMNVGSLVVGQYYMSVISLKLDIMTESIDRIGDFQDREFKSRILSVITLVGEISQFSSEIMENDEQRNIKLVSLESLKATATELLGQVNITMSEIIQQTPNPDYKEYQSKVDDFQKLVGYQSALVSVLDEISNLTYLLGMGSISTERSYLLYNKYLELSVQTRAQLGQWHDNQVKALRIDLDNERIRKTGFEGFFSAFPGVFFDSLNYNGLSPNILNGISDQAQNIPVSCANPKSVYEEDVEIIIKDGKYYYLYESSVS